LNATFRADATNVIAITTDAPMHEAADSSCTTPSPPCPFPYPGPSFADTVAALNAAGIKVVTIKAPGATTQMDDLATQTGGVVTTTGATSAEIVAAITGGIEKLTFDVTATPVGCAPLDVTFVPPIHEDVEGGATVTFQETIAVPASAAAGEVTCTVEFKANDTVIATQDVHVTIITPEQCAGETATMVGTGGDDTIIGTPGRDVVQAFGGEDQVIGLGGDDLICGDAGDDDLSGGGGDDLLFGNGGVDELSGGRGVDRVMGGPGVDEVSGDSGDDRVIGEAGFDELSGGSGDDGLKGRRGNDELSAGSGDDRLAGGPGEDELSAGSGDDRLAGGDGDDGLNGGDGTDDCDGGAGTDSEANCETVVNVP
jgi:Ca2+-binding RTX toxin-like protein